MEETKGQLLVNGDNNNETQPTVVIENVEIPEFIIIEDPNADVRGIKIVLADYYIWSAVSEGPRYQLNNESNSSIPVVVIENERRVSQDGLESSYRFDNSGELCQPLDKEPNEVDKSSKPKKKIGEMKRHKCKYCMKCFKRKNCLNRHLRLHTGERPYKCTICEKTFIERGALVVHFRIHTGVRPYSCSHCEKTFRHRSNMKMHEIRHSEDKRHLCPFCKKKFITSGNWKKHLRTHSNDKDYMSKEFSEDFKTPKVLTEHKAPDEKKIHAWNTVQRSPNESPRWTECSTSLNRCNVCSKLFSNSGSLKVHMRMHTGEKPYKCLMCLKGFTRYSTLRKHINIHTGVRPYECQICQKTFTGSFTLKLHIRTHTGEKPYHCDICGANFSQKSNLKRHQRSRHILLNNNQ